MVFPSAGWKSGALILSLNLNAKRGNDLELYSNGAIGATWTTPIAVILQPIPVEWASSVSSLAHIIIRFARATTSARIGRDVNEVNQEPTHSSFPLSPAQGSRRVDEPRRITDDS